MSQYPEKTLALTRCLRAATKSRPKQSLMARKGTFGLPALAVLAAMETPLHLSSVFTLGPLAALTTPVQGDDRGAHAQVLATETMIFLAVEGGVAQDTVPGDEQRRLFHGRSELRPVIAGTSTDSGRDEEMTLSVADDG